MSLVSLLKACEQHIRTQLALPTREVSVEEDGQPHPEMGKRAIVVSGGSWQPGDPSEGYIDEKYHVIVTITYRLTQTPADRVWESLWAKAQTGMQDLMRNINSTLHQSYPLLTIANTLQAEAEGKLTTDPTFYPFIEPLQWAGGDATPRQELGDWLYSDNPETIAKKAALVAVLNFSDCRRIIYNP